MLYRKLLLGFLALVFSMNICAELDKIINFIDKRIILYKSVSIRDQTVDGIMAPELIVVPAGTNTLGDSTGEGIEIERPTYKVTIDKPFAIGKYEVTFEEYDYFIEQTGHKKPDRTDMGVIYGPPRIAR